MFSNVLKVDEDACLTLTHDLNKMPTPPPFPRLRGTCKHLPQWSHFGNCMGLSRICFFQPSLCERQNIQFIFHNEVSNQGWFILGWPYVEQTSRYGFVICYFLFVAVYFDQVVLIYSTPLVYLGLYTSCGNMYRYAVDVSCISQRWGHNSQSSLLQSPARRPRRVGRRITTPSLTRVFHIEWSSRSQLPERKLYMQC